MKSFFFILMVASVARAEISGYEDVPYSVTCRSERQGALETIEIKGQKLCKFDGWMCSLTVGASSNARSAEVVSDILITAYCKVPPEGCRASDVTACASPGNLSKEIHQQMGLSMDPNNAIDKADGALSKEAQRSGKKVSP